MGNVKEHLPLDGVLVHRFLGDHVLLGVFKQGESPLVISFLGSDEGQTQIGVKVGGLLSQNVLVALSCLGDLVVGLKPVSLIEASSEPNCNQLGMFLTLDVKLKQLIAAFYGLLIGLH